MVAIRSDFVENDLLRTIVLADTPGTGDPILAHEIAQDFLPICDLIIYFFSAAVPFDSADIPLLTEKSSQLSFIPIRFVITRADEFKKDRLSQLSDENFDSSKSDIFLSELSQRVRFLFKDSSDIDPDRFMLIDNIDKYNINLLRQSLIDFADVRNINFQMNIQGYKILYFRESAEKLQEFFCSFLIDKLKSLSEVLNTADSNIIKFKDKIRVSNNNLTQSWSDKLVRINGVKIKVISSKLMEELVLPKLEVFSTSQQDWKFREAVTDRGAEIKGKINGSLVSQLKKILSDKKKLIESLSTLDDTEVSQILILDLKNISKDKLFENVEVLPSPNSYSNSFSSVKEMDSKLLECYDNFGKKLTEIHQVLVEQEPLKDLKLIIDTAINDLGADFDAYFESINIYRTGVFSLGIKDPIARLGLGSQMDQLESDKLTDVQKSDIKQEAEEYIFPDSKDTLNMFSNQLNLMTSKIGELQAEQKRTSSIRILKADLIPVSEDQRKILSEGATFIRYIRSPQHSVAL